MKFDYMIANNQELSAINESIDEAYSMFCDDSIECSYDGVKLSFLPYGDLYTFSDGHTEYYNIGD